MSESIWWRFYVDNYFPYMYGLMRIEIEAEEKNKDIITLQSWKTEFMQEIIKYLEKNQIFYMKETLEEILKFDMNKEFRRVLIEKYKHWPNNVMQDIFKILENVTNKSPN